MEQHLIKKKCPICKCLTVIDKNRHFNYCLYCGEKLDISSLNSQAYKNKPTENKSDTFKCQVLNNIPFKETLQKEWDDEVECYLSYFVDSLLKKINEQIIYAARKEEYYSSDGKRYISGEFFIYEKNFLISCNKDLLQRVFPNESIGGFFNHIVNTPKVNTDYHNIHFTTYDGDYRCYGELFKINKDKKGAQILTTTFWDLALDMLIKKAALNNISINYKGIQVSVENKYVEETFLSIFSSNDKFKKKVDNSYIKIINSGEFVKNFLIAGNVKYDYRLVIEFDYEF